jgi:hypothetical protein
MSVTSHNGFSDVVGTGHYPTGFVLWKGILLGNVERLGGKTSGEGLIYAANVCFLS